MALSSIPVLLPMSLEEGDQGTMIAAQVDAVASGPEPAIAAARLLGVAAAMLNFQRKPRRVVNDRIQVGKPAYTVVGPYAYVLTHSLRVPTLCLPSRLDSAAGEEFAQSLAGLRPELVHGVVLDCAPLQFINTTGLSALVEHSRRLRLHLFRVPPAIRKVLEIIGLDRHLELHADLRSALTTLVGQARIGSRADLAAGA